MKNALLACVAAVLCLLAPACRSPLEGGAGARFVSASRSAHDLWGERLKGYLAADPELAPLLKDQLVKSVDDWELAIAAAEEAVKPDVALPMPVPALPGGHP